MQALWNREITDALVTGAEGAARAAGCTVERFTVSGAFELPAAVRALAETKRFDAVIPLGCLIRGETPHFQVLADAVAGGLMTLSLTMPCAVALGVLTCDTPAQATARAGGAKGNAGAEAVAAALSVVALRRSLQ